VFAEHPVHDYSKAPLLFAATSGKPFSVLMDEAMLFMHQNMYSAQKTGKPDHAFVAIMIPRHQGTIDMAKALLRYGKNPEITNLSQWIISAQLNEIKFMTVWLKTYKTASSKTQAFSLLKEWPRL